MFDKALFIHSLSNGQRHLIFLILLFWQTIYWSNSFYFICHKVALSKGFCKKSAKKLMSKLIGYYVNVHNRIDIMMFQVLQGKLNKMFKSFVQFRWTYSPQNVFAKQFTAKMLCSSLPSRYSVVGVLESLATSLAVLEDRLPSWFLGAAEQLDTYRLAWIIVE